MLKLDDKSITEAGAQAAAACAMCGLERRVIKVVRVESRKDVRLQ